MALSSRSYYGKIRGKLVHLSKYYFSIAKATSLL